MNGESARDWDSGWRQLETTIGERDVWLLTDHIKLHYLSQVMPRQARTLEVGCGSAKLSALLAQRGARVTGLDLSPQALRVAGNNLAGLRKTGDLVQGDVFRLPFEDGIFDAVISTGLLEHFQNPVPIVKEMARVLRPGGVFFSDIAPLKFSLLRTGFFLRGLYKTTRDEYGYRGEDIRRWLSLSGLRDARVFSSGVVPPLGMVRRVSFIRKVCFSAERLLILLDGTWVADLLGFFYLAFAIKPALVQGSAKEAGGVSCE